MTVLAQIQTSSLHIKNLYIYRFKFAQHSINPNYDIIYIMENNLTKEPTLEEYGLDASSYENYRQQKESLEKTFKEYKESFKIDDATSLISKMAFVFWVSCVVAIVYSNFWIAVSGYVLSIILDHFFIEPTRKEFRALIQLKEIETNQKIDLLKSNIKPFEEASVKYYTNCLEEFYQNNLYKKRSGGPEFERLLSEFSSMISEVKDINNKLIFSNISTYSHKNYLTGRQINHISQKTRKFSSFDNIEVKTGEGKEINEGLVADPNQKIKEEFRKKVELERIEKEKIRLMPPEKKFRTARKVDNWEEINKKRKETGDKGEEVVFLLEQDHLESINRKDLADKVCHSSKEKGDGLGYDILSYFDDGREKFIEVKSTNNSINSAFNISKNELEFLKENLENAFLYRVSFQEEVPEVEVRTSPQILESEITATQFIVKLE